MVQKKIKSKSLQLQEGHLKFVSCVSNLIKNTFNKTYGNMH